MADAKISSFASHGTPVGADYVASVLASGPTSKKLLMSDLRDYTGLVHVAASPTTAGVTGVINTLHLLDISGLTATRNFTLPATAAVGDRVGVYLTTGDDTYALVLIGDTGDTINGGAGATEWRRLFITNECVIFRCITANSAWIVEYDGRIPQKGLMRLSTAAAGEAAATFTRPTQAATPGAWTAEVAVGCTCSTFGDSITVRRAGNYNLSYVALLNSALTDQEGHGGALYFNGTANILHAATLYASGVAVQSSTGVVLGYPMAAGDYVVYQYRSILGAKGLAASALPRLTSSFSLVEVF